MRGFPPASDAFRGRHAPVWLKRQVLSVVPIKNLRWLLCVSLILVLSWPVLAGAGPVISEHVTARLLAERKQAAPGETAQLALAFEIRPGWHTYWKNPGDSGEAPRIHWLLPDGVTAGPIRWLRPELIRVGPLANYGYSGKALHLIDLAIPADWEPGRPIDLVAEVSWLVCAEHCIPEDGTLSLRIDTGPQPGPVDPQVAEVFASARSDLPRPLSGEAALRSQGAGLLLEVDSPDLPQEPDRAWFFAGAWGLVDHAAEQILEVSDGRLILQLAPGALAEEAAADGVLVIEEAGAATAYEVRPIRGDSQSTSGERSAPAAADLGLPLALGLALLGGIILNLMPCVFPVLALKALSLTLAKGADAKSRLLQGLAYTLGVLSFFALIAATLLALRAGGSSVGWGFQLQSPGFVVLMSYLFFVLGLSLAGAVNLGARLMGFAAAGPTSGAGGAFVTGALAALVAAPCTAPFMGAALGYALTLSWPGALAVTMTLGFGLALPFLLLSLIPGIAKILPKPGKWMVNLKQFLAFPMFATAAWLVWVLAVQRGADAVAAVLAGMLFLALGLWTLERSRQSVGGWRLLGGIASAAFGAFALLLGALPGRVDFRSVATEDGLQRRDAGPLSQPFSPERLQAARAQRRPVFVNMTAAWCITCLVNERLALSSVRVAQAFDASGVLYMKGDWTNRDAGITRYLERFGRSGVPIYVLYPSIGSPRVLPQILTESIVLEELASIAVSSVR